MSDDAFEDEDAEDDTEDESEEDLKKQSWCRLVSTTGVTGTELHNRVSSNR